MPEKPLSDSRQPKCAKAKETIAIFVSLRTSLPWRLRVSGFVEAEGLQL
jgi:hypothetical protein